MPLIADPVARKYVQALLEIAQERDQVDQIRDTLCTLQQTLAEVPELLGAISHPDLSAEQKREMLRAAGADDSSPLVAGFLDLLIRDNQLAILPQGAELFEQLHYELQGVQPASVETLVPLSDEQRARLQTALEQIAGRPVVLEEKISPEIGGGLCIRLGDATIDASLQGRLRKMGDAVCRGEC